MKYTYPSVLFPRDGLIHVEFPDLPTCYTDGKDWNDAVEMAEDALGLILWVYEDHKKEIPKPSAPNSIRLPKDGYLAYITADTEPVRKMNSKRSVRKNVTMPEWLDTLAKERHINLSNFLQNALAKEFNVSLG